MPTLNANRFLYHFELISFLFLIKTLIINLKINLNIFSLLT